LTQSEIVRWQIKSILVEVLALEIEPAQLGDDALLFDGQLALDSVATIEILARIEDAFDIELDDEEVGLHLFQSVDTLAAAVLVHLGRQQSGLRKERSFPRDHGP
jgi:acyl carrier protein